MLSEETLERLSERLVNRIESLNTYFINKLGEQIVDIGKLTPSQLREVFQSVKYGNNLDDIVNKLAEITDKNVKDIYDIFEEVAKKNQEYAKQFYKYRNKKFIPFDKNKSLQNQVKAIANITANKYINMSKTFAYTTYKNGIKEFTSLSETYQKITDEAILSLSQGRESFDTIMKRTMKQLTSNGLKTVDYASGYSRRADSSVRMNIMDGMRRVNRELQIQFGKEFDSDGIEVSHHIYPAPDHEDTIDGKQFSIKGKVTIKGITYEDYDTVNDSLDRHIGELNCYHYVYSIILGISKPLYSKEQLESDKKKNHDGFEFEGKHYTMYEGTQLQRQIETKIREYKDRQIGAKSINDTDEVYHCQEKIGQLTKKYNDLHKASGLPTKVDRLRVEGYKKKKIVKSDFTDVTQEWLDKATPNSHKVLDRNYFEYEGVKYKVDGKKVVLDYTKKEKETAEWLENTFGGKIYMNPRVNSPDGIPTADYLFRNEYWDLKEITEKATSKFRAVDNVIKNSKNQTENIILDISSNKIGQEIIINQVKKIYSTKGREWINKIIVVDNKQLLLVYQRNKKRD